MKKILTGIFKRWICFPLAIILWLLSHPFNLCFLFIPGFIYWLITGRDIMKDGDDFIDYSTS